VEKSRPRNRRQGWAESSQRVGRPINQKAGTNPTSMDRTGDVLEGPENLWISSGRFPLQRSGVRVMPSRKRDKSRLTCLSRLGANESGGTWVGRRGRKGNKGGGGSLRSRARGSAMLINGAVPIAPESVP